MKWIVFQLYLSEAERNVIHPIKTTAMVKMITEIYNKIGFLRFLFAIVSSFLSELRGCRLSMSLEGCQFGISVYLFWSIQLRNQRSLGSPTPITEFASKIMPWICPSFSKRSPNSHCFSICSSESSMPSSAARASSSSDVSHFLTLFDEKRHPNNRENDYLAA